MKYFSSFILIILISGCSVLTNNKLHVAQLNENSYLYWTSSERVVWYDTYTGSIRLKVKGSTNNVRFDQTANGLIFKKRQSDVGDIDGVCGRVLSHNFIEDIEDTITIQITCTNVPNAFNVGNTEYPYIPTPITLSVKTCSINDIEQLNEESCINGN
jgi:hypothetical protein